MGVVSCLKFVYLIITAAKFTRIDAGGQVDKVDDQSVKREQLTRTGEELEASDSPDASAESFAEMEAEMSGRGDGNRLSGITALSEFHGSPDVCCCKSSTNCDNKVGSNGMKSRANPHTTPMLCCRTYKASGGANPCSAATHGKVMKPAYFCNWKEGPDNADGHLDSGADSDILGHEGEFVVKGTSPAGVTPQFTLEAVSMGGDPDFPPDGGLAAALEQLSANYMREIQNAAEADQGRLFEEMEVQSAALTRDFVPEKPIGNTVDFVVRFREPRERVLPERKPVVPQRRGRARISMASMDEGLLAHDFESEALIAEAADTDEGRGLGAEVMGYVTVLRVLRTPVFGADRNEVMFDLVYATPTAQLVAEASSTAKPAVMQEIVRLNIEKILSENEYFNVDTELATEQAGGKLSFDIGVAVMAVYGTWPEQLPAVTEASQYGRHAPWLQPIVYNNRVVRTFMENQIAPGAAYDLFGKEAGVQLSEPSFLKAGVVELHSKAGHAASLAFTKEDDVLAQVAVEHVGGHAEDARDEALARRMAASSNAHSKLARARTNGGKLEVRSSNVPTGDLLDFGDMPSSATGMHQMPRMPPAPPASGVHDLGEMAGWLEGMGDKVGGHTDLLSTAVGTGQRPSYDPAFDSRLATETFGPGTSVASHTHGVPKTTNVFDPFASLPSQQTNGFGDEDPFAAFSSLPPPPQNRGTGATPFNPFD